MVIKIITSDEDLDNAFQESHYQLEQDIICEECEKKHCGCHPIIQVEDSDEEVYNFCSKKCLEDWKKNLK